MGINDSIYYYNFSEIYRNFKRFSVMDIVDESSFEKANRDNIIKLLSCIDEKYDFSRFLKKYNEYRLRDFGSTFSRDRVTYVSNSNLDKRVGRYDKNDKYSGNDKLSYTCYLLDGILFNMRNWKP